MTATETSSRKLNRLSYVRIGEKVDTATGIVYYRYSNRPRGFVTKRWMRNHGWISDAEANRPECVGNADW